MVQIPQVLLNPTGTESVPLAARGGAIASASDDLDRVDPAFPCSRIPVLRLIFLSIVGLAEVLGLGLLVDTGALSARSIWWGAWVGHAPQLLQIVIAACAAWTFLGWGAARLVLHSQASSIARHSFVGRFIAHLGCYAAFAWLSWVFLAMDSSTNSRLSDEGWLAAWLIVGIATVLTFAASAWPFAVWKLLLVRSR